MEFKITSLNEFYDFVNLPHSSNNLYFTYTSQYYKPGLIHKVISTIDIITQFNTKYYVLKYKNVFDQNDEIWYKIINIDNNENDYINFINSNLKFSPYYFEWIE